MTADTVLFDLDGTLIDSTYHCALSWARAFARFDVHPPLWQVHRTIGMGGDKLVEHVAGEQVEQEHGDALRDAWLEEYKPLLDEARAFDGVPELVASLRGRGLKVALATSSDADLADKGLEILGMTKDDFDAVTTSSDADESKPSPDILAAALEAAGGTQAVLVGDATWDIEAAKRLGMPTVCVRTGGFGVDELQRTGAVLVVDAVGDLATADWDRILDATVPDGAQPA